ncbi:hypothetical protein [Nocardia noduli]|nr:hypothetical protein [Nocardia noduli]
MSDPDSDRYQLRNHGQARVDDIIAGWRSQQTDTDPSREHHSENQCDAR